MSVDEFHLPLSTTPPIDHVAGTGAAAMKPVKRRDLKAILRQEPETGIERRFELARTTTTTTSDVWGPTVSCSRRASRESPSPAPLPPSPDVSELIFHVAGSRNVLPPPPPASPSPSKKRPRSPASRNSTSMSRSPSPSRSRRSPLPDRVFTSPAPRANSTQSTNLTPFAKRLKVGRQTPPPPPAAALFSRSQLKTPSPQPARPHVTPRGPSSSPVARSAPPTTPSPSTLPEEPGSSPFPEEDEDEKDDGPGFGGGLGGNRAGTGDLDELEEFYGTKESSPSKDAGENEGEQSRSQSLNLKDSYGFQTQAFPRSTLGEDSY
ncbi:hypothetical protein FRC01_006516 [Tulasnella sp. 417]|nr:hypothetical protein FRC01_006516 [Tulasnella sp. 417]